MSPSSKVEMSHIGPPRAPRHGHGDTFGDDHDARSRPHQDDAGVVVAPSCQPDFLQFGFQQRLVRQLGLILDDERRTGRSAEGVFPLPHHCGVGHSMKPRAFWLMRWPRAPRSVKWPQCRSPQLSFLQRMQLDLCVGKLGHHAQLTAERLDVVTQSADVHIFSALQL